MKCSHSQFVLNVDIIMYRLYYMAQLFPSIFNDKLSENLLTLLKKWLEGAIFAFVQTNQASQTAVAANAQTPKHDLQQPLKVKFAFSFKSVPLGEFRIAALN